MAITVPQLQAYMESGLRIMITGPAGTGKTAMLEQAAKNLNWNMKYFSASTMDPILELVGIPVPNTDKGEMEFYRDSSLDEADVIFFDEVTRAPASVINSIFEVTQFGRIHGKPLPRLKTVVVACNPPEEGYEGVEELDLAFRDRFDVFLESKVEADYTYLKTKFGPAYARAGKALFDEYQRDYNSQKRSSKNSMGYFSPRRLEKLMDVFQKFPKQETIRVVLPADVQIPIKHVSVQFQDAILQDSGKAPVAAPIAADMATAVDEQLQKAAADLRRKANAKPFLAAYAWARENDTAKAQKLLTGLAVALSYNVGPDTIKKVWGAAVQDFNPSQKTMMMNDWAWTKKDQANRALGW